MSDPAASPLGIEGLEDASEIGVGGFATVYKAFQPAFRRTVAVKVLAALNLDEAARERFERECQAMGSLSEHPNIVTVYGAGFTTSGRPYLVMAYLPGGSMAERLAQSGPLSWQEATLIGVHLAGALETAHQAGIIHRDIKPGNVLMSTYGDAQLTDFGIARISGGHETRSGVITASMSHAPPEVLDGERPSVLADVYSLGSTLFELLTGAPAFQVEGDESMVPMLRRILTEAPPDLRSRGVPDAVCQVIEQSMAKTPADRQPSAAVLGRQIQAVRASLGLEPGKLTLPAGTDVADEAAAGETISFVAAAVVDPAAVPPPTPPPAPGAAPVPPVAPPAPAPPGPAVPVDPTPAAPAATYSAYAPPADGAYGYPPAGQGTAEGGPPAYATAGAPPATPPAKKRTGLLVGLVVFLLVLVLGVGAAIVLTRGSGETASGTTSSLASSTTASSTSSSSTSTSTSTTVEESSTTTAALGYNRVIERQFVRECAQGGAVSDQFCQCVYEQFRDTVPFERFRDLDDRARKGEQVGKDPTFRQITQACQAKLGPAATPAPGGAAGAPA
ncbi:MAG: serine/threonine-protein kinase [Acidimicrobiales bacterium]